MSYGFYLVTHAGTYRISFGNFWPKNEIFVHLDEAIEALDGPLVGPIVGPLVKWLMRTLNKGSIRVSGNAWVVL